MSSTTSQMEIVDRGLTLIQVLDRCGGVQSLLTAWLCLCGKLYEGSVICYGRISPLQDLEKRPGHMVADYFSIQDLASGVLKGPDGYLYDAIFLEVASTGGAAERALEPTLTPAGSCKDVGGVDPVYPWDAAMDLLMVERLSGKGHFETKAELRDALIDKVISLCSVRPSEGAASRHLKKYWPELYKASGRPALSDRGR
jgi:hypothetical protein